MLSHRLPINLIKCKLQGRFRIYNSGELPYNQWAKYTIDEMSSFKNLQLPFQATPRELVQGARTYQQRGCKEKDTTTWTHQLHRIHSSSKVTLQHRLLHTLLHLAVAYPTAPSCSIVTSLYTNTVCLCLGTTWSAPSI